MNILFISSEVYPFAYCGGLGEVVSSLTKALAKIDVESDVRCVMPLYSSVSREYREKMKYCGFYYTSLSWRHQYCGVFEYEEGNVKYYFLDNEYYFKRNMMYGDFDDAERYAYFSKAALELPYFVKWMPDIVHANDWQSALSVIYQRCFNILPNAKTVYTIHNIEYQGRYSMDIYSDILGLNEAFEGVVRFNGDINLTKGAICSCDRLTTVSKRYAKEIQTEYYAHSLDSVIRDNSVKLKGIVNGIDVEKYKIIDKKEEVKERLQKLCNLPVDSNIPIFSMVTRLVSHKGIDLVIRVIDEIMKADIQLILLGKGDFAYERAMTDIQKRYCKKMCVKIGFDSEASKEIYRGSDFFLMPSKSEPCGIAQMIASINGTIPIVRETGGLYDTIKPYNPCTNEGNGITFATYNAHDMLGAIWRAIGIYNDKQQFYPLRRNAEEADFSVYKSAEEYLKLYKEMMYV